MIPRVCRWPTGGLRGVWRLALVLVVWQSSGAQEVPDRRELEFANKLLRDRRYDLAAEEYARVLAAAPDDADARYGLATARWFLGDYPAARKQFEQLLRAAPNHPGAATAWFRVGETAYLLGDLPAARQALETYTTRYPDHRLNDTAWIYLGEVRFRQGDLDGAGTAYEHALTRYPGSRLGDRARYGQARLLTARRDYAGALSLLQALLQGGSRDWADKATMQVGMVHLAAGQPEAALRTFEALERDAPQSPLVPEGRFRRAEALSRLGRPAEAEAILRPLAASENGVAPQAACALAGVLLDQNRPADALTACDDALKRFPDTPLSPWLWYQSAAALAALGKPGEARTRFLKVVETNPKDEWADDALLRAAELALKAGDHAAARALARSLPQRFPASPRRPHARLIEAQAALAAEDAAAAIALLEPLLADPSLDAGVAQAARVALSVAYRTNGQPEQAERVLQAAAAPAAAAPAASAEAQYLLGVGHFDAHRYAEAIPAFEAYLAARPKGNVVPDALALLAIAYDAAGQTQKASETLDRLTAQFPSSKPLTQARLRLGEAALKAKSYDRARALLQAVADTAADRETAVRALWGLAWSEFEGHRPAEAAASFGRLLERAPEDPRAPDAALARARALEAAGRTAEASAAYGEAGVRGAKSARVSAAAELGRARLLARLGRSVEAAGAFKTYLEKHPVPVDPSHDPTDIVLAEYGWALLDAGKGAEAAVVFRRLLDEFPASPRGADARAALAEAAHAGRQLHEAENLLAPLVAEGAQVDPALVQSALFRLGLIRFDRKDWPAARAAFQRLITEYPDGRLRAKARFWAGEAAFQAGDAAAAAAEFAAAAEAAAAEAADWLPTARLRHVECLVALERWSDALAEAEALRAAAPTFPALHELDYARGRALQGLARFDEARAAFQAVIDAHRDDDFATRAQLMRGETFFHQQKYHEALKEFLRVVYADEAPRPLKAAALLEAGKVAERLERWSDAADFYRQLTTRFPDDPQAQPAAQRLEALPVKPPSREP